MRYLTLVCLLSLEGIVCKKTMNTTAVMYYNQTQCADPWGEGKTEAELKEKVKSYLETKSIHVWHVVIFRYLKEAEMLCMACKCPSGKRFKANIAMADTARARALGFFQ